MEEIMNNEIMETEVEVAKDQEIPEDNYYPATAEDSATDGGSAIAGFVKLAALGVGGFVVAKKFVWDKKLKPMHDEKRAAKKAKAEAAEEAKFEAWAVKRGLLVPAETTTEETDGEVQDVNPEELTEEKKD